MDLRLRTYGLVDSKFNVLNLFSLYVHIRITWCHFQTGASVHNLRSSISGRFSRTKSKIRFRKSVLPNWSNVWRIFTKWNNLIKPFSRMLPILIQSKLSFLPGKARFDSAFRSYEVYGLHSLTIRTTFKFRFYKIAQMTSTNDIFWR